MDTPLLKRMATGDSPGLWTFTVEEYHRLLEAAILPEGSQVELIDGVLVLKDRRDGEEAHPMNVGPRHASTATRIHLLLHGLVEPHGCHARCQQPITIPPRHEPEPDVALVVGDVGDYSVRHPGPDEVVLSIEVSLSSLRHDRDTKQRVYAEAGIPTYWVVDVPAGQIEVYTLPLAGQGRYGELRTHDQDDTVSLALPDGSTLDVPAADLLPR